MDKKILVVYYSRTGITKKVAENISAELGCDIQEIIDTKDRSGAIGYMLAGRDATKNKLTELKEISKDASEYDLVIIGTPIWAFTVSTPTRTYILQNKDKFKEVAFFCTQGGSGSKRAFKAMEEIIGKNPIGLLELRTIEVAKDLYKDKVTEFISSLKG